MIPPGLTQRVRSGHGVLVAGLGFFAAPAARGWESVLRGLVERLVSARPEAREMGRWALDLVARGRQGAALAWLRRQLPEEVVRQAMAELPGNPGLYVERIHRVARLPWRGIVTTCFQSVWERNWESGRVRRLDARHLSNGVRTDDLKNPFLLHALGTLEDQETLGLCPADLRKRSDAAAIAGFLRGQFAKQTFVFAGFEPSDPDLRLVVDHLLGFAPTDTEHFLLLPESSLADTDLSAETVGAELDLVPATFSGDLDTLFGRWADGEEPALSEVGAAEGAADEAGDLPEGDIEDIEPWLREQYEKIANARPGERATLFEGLGDVYRQRLGNPIQAMASYRAAHSAEPGRRSVLLKLAELYRGHKHWTGAEETLVKLAHTEPTAEGRARVLCQAATIAMDELDRPARAAQLLERALEDGGDITEAFDALERLLNQEKNWQTLARLYQKAAREIDPDGPARAVKLRAMEGLADLAVRFSKDPKLAVRALEAAEKLDSHNPERKVRLAQILSQSSPGERDRAIALYHEAIALDPDRFTAYRALADCYRERGDRDRLWCVAATLTFLRKADEEIRDLYERGKAARTGPVGQRFTSEVWARVAHPDEDRDLSSLFGVLGPILAGIQAVSPEALGLGPGERATAAFAEELGGKALSAVRSALDVPPLGIYLRAGEKRPVSLHILRDGAELVPTLLLGGPLLGTTDLAQAKFHLARSLVLLRPELIVCALESGRTAARVAMDAALQMAGLKPPAESLRTDVEKMVAELAALLPLQTRDQIVATTRRLIAKQGGGFPDVDRWCNAVELSAARAAFLLVNDLVVAAHLLTAEAASARALTVKQRLKDLVGFSVSERYFEARRMLGLSLG